MLMSQAILTRYYASTDTRDAQIVARCEAGRLLVLWKKHQTTTENHQRAAETLFSSLGWNEDSELIGGALYDNQYAFVAVESVDGDIPCDLSCVATKESGGK